MGYGNSRTGAGLASVLRRYGIARLVDVRSKPYSRRRREFSREPLDAALTGAGLEYLWMGDTLGGKPEDPACCTGGEVDYAKIRTKAWFRQGITELEAARASGVRLAVMCAELAPERCHRAWLIGEALVADGVPVMHIDGDDSLVPHEQVIERLTRGQRTLFGL